MNPTQNALDAVGIARLLESYSPQPDPVSNGISAEQGASAETAAISANPADPGNASRTSLAVDGMSRGDATLLGRFGFPRPFSI